MVYINRAILSLSIIFSLNLAFISPAIATTCSERWPGLLLDFEMRVASSTRVLLPNGELDFYDVTFNVETTRSPGGTVTYDTGTVFKQTFTTENLQKYLIQASLNGERYRSKEFVFKPGTGIIKGPRANFDLSYVDGTVFIENQTLNRNGKNLEYRWDFDEGSNPFFSSEENPPPVTYLTGPGTYCIRLDVQERSGPFNEIARFDQRDAIAKEISVLDDVPIASFDYEVLGRLLRTENLSSHPTGQRLSYSWDFGDGTTSTDENPEHVYQQPGMYFVELTAMDVDGDNDVAVEQIITENVLVLEVDPPAQLRKREDAEIAVTVYNYEADDITNFSIDSVTDPDILSVNIPPDPDVPTSLAKDMRFETTYTVVPQQTGETAITVTASGLLVSGADVSVALETPLFIDPELELEFVSPPVEIVGEEAVFTLTITNREDVAIEGLRIESLGLSTGNPTITPESLLTYIAGPIGPNGVDPRVTPLTLQPGETIIVVWRYRTEARGTVNLQAFLSFDRPNGSGRVLQTGESVVAIDTASLQLSQLRLQPTRHIPGSFGFVRGKITNGGNFDIEDIDFEIDASRSEPEFIFIEELVASTSADVSPRIDVLKPDETRDFIIVVGSETLLPSDSIETYTFPLKFTGTAEVEGEDIEVSIETVFEDDLDRSSYWTNILDQSFQNLIDGLIAFVDQLERDAEVSESLAASLGATDAFINDFLVPIGEGLIAAEELLEDVVEFAGETSGDGGIRLSNEANELLDAITRYYSQTTPTQRLIDIAELQEDAALGLGDLTVETLDALTTWHVNLQMARERGDTREVARLLTQSGILVGGTLSGELAAEQLTVRVLTRLRNNRVLRKAVRQLRKKRVISGFDPIEDIDELIDLLDRGFDDLPSGTSLTIDEAVLAGLEGDDLSFMLKTAREKNVTFFARPRPATAAKWSRLEYNAKPLKIKLKSVNDIDIDWLGFNAADEGLIVLAEPTPPFKAIEKALAEGRLDARADSQLIIDIGKRYNQKRADFENRNKFVAEFNQTRTHKVSRPDPDFPGEFITEEITAPGEVVKRFGSDRVTTIRLEPGTNRLIMDHNDLPIYSDVDLLSLARPDGSNIMPDDLHRQILDESGFGFDGQHHATAQTSDFPNAKVARKVAIEFMLAHSRGGEGLLAVGPNGIRKVFVESYNIISLEKACELVDGLDAVDIPSNRDLYGKIVESVRYTGTPVE